YGLPFFIPAEQGNLGRSGPSQQEFWSPIPIRKVLKISPPPQAGSKVTFNPSAESTELRLDKRGLPSREKTRYRLSRFNLLNSAARATPPCASTTSRRPTRKTSGPSS